MSITLLKKPAGVVSRSGVRCVRDIFLVDALRLAQQNRSFATLAAIRPGRAP
jgi:hypothetical protein